MELSQLRMVKAVAECGSIALAAEQLHCVPSNITTRIKQLESELGTALFTRAGRGLRISAAGQVFLGYSEQILALVDQAKRAVAPQAVPAGKLRIGAIESCATGRLPPLLADYHQRYPQVILELVTGKSKQLLDDVKHHRLDGAMVAGSITQTKLSKTMLYNEQLVLIASPKLAPLAQLADVHRHTVFMWPPGCPYRAALENWVAEHGLEVSKIDYANWGSIIGCVSAGAGLALIPEGMLQQFGACAHLITYRFPELAPMPNLFFWHSETGSHAARDAFAALLAEHFPVAVAEPARLRPIA